VRPSEESRSLRSPFVIVNSCERSFSFQSLFQFTPLGDGVGVRKLGSLPSGASENSVRVTFDAWERALTKRLLSVDGSGDASPIRSFEITSETLAEAVADFGIKDPETAVRSFKRVVCDGPRFYRALREGMAPLNSTEVPGFFSYLVLTLLVASLPAEQDQLGGAFRRKLSEFLECQRTFTQLQGVELMWLAWSVGSINDKRKGLRFAS
jgi:hypothetical protein